jgi:hypothetical protein
MFYSLEEMYLLAVASNAGAGCTVPDKVNRPDEINLCVAREVNSWLEEFSLIPRWQIVWGPAVYVANVEGHTLTDAHPAYDAEHSSYFISVAGTNGAALYDLEEDFRVRVLRHWPYAAPGSRPGKISEGSHLGLNILQEMTPGVGQHQGETLPQYLRHALRDAKGPVNVITGGHSLGGALSPLVALWLRDTQEQWDPRRVVPEDGFYCRRSAGPTPGDKEFAAYYDGRLPKTTSLVNNLDVVTKFWDKLEEIEGLYESAGVQAPPQVKGLVRAFEHQIEGHTYTQLGYGKRQYIAPLASINTSLIAEHGTACKNFMRQMGYQHVLAYFDMLGLAVPEKMRRTIGVDQFLALCG